MVLLLVGGAPFGLVGLKCSSGDRCILRRCPISVGAALAVARPCVGRRAGSSRPTGGDASKGGGGKPPPYRFPTNLPGLGRGGPRASRRGLPELPRGHPHQPPSGAPSLLEGEGWAGGPGVPPLRSDYEPSGMGGHMGPLLRRETNRERWLGNPGAVAEPQQRQFLQGQGPVARNETIKATQILRAGNTAKPDRYASPVVGVLGGRRI